MRHRRRFAVGAGILALGLCVILAMPAARGGEPVDWEAVNRIRDEGLHRSKVMEVLEHLTDRIGPRLTGSPAMDAANRWTLETLQDWGLENAHLEGYPFGRGWSFERCRVEMISPRAMPLQALPQAWTPGTRKTAEGEAMRVTLETDKDLEEQKGKLKGKILFLDGPRSFEPSDEAPFQRYDEDDLDALELFPVPGERGRDWRERYRRRLEFRRKRNQFLEDEGVLAVVEVSSRPDGILRVTSGGSYRTNEPKGVPALTMAAEHYNMILRQLEAGEAVRLRLDVRARFHEAPEAFNTIAELPGTDLGDQIVMAGAHLDSWHAGTGATDNAAGCAVVMEAVRILKAIGVRPRRTIRVALWSGEEQGLLGSRAYVHTHFARRPEPEDPEERRLPPFLWSTRGPLDVLPDHALLSAYFNLDNGGGRIRGIYAQENVAAVPIFRAWLEPVRDLGADTVTSRNTRGTDHLSFDGVGLPGFQFIQDRLDYFSRTHHSNLDVLDHIRREDLVQASVVMATFLYHAAMREERLPRKPLPRPEETGREGAREGKGEAAGRTPAPGA